jgi:RNA polymerase sigma factor (sigma-70 family)
MAAAQVDVVIRRLRRAVLPQDEAGRTDRQLLASFIDQKDEAAFEAIVRRHGPMVFGVCRRVARDHHDAEDAFQATFLVLARKASSVSPGDRLANWLHGVALRTALKVKAMAAKRRGRERQVTEMPEPEAAQQDQWLDLRPLLDQELKGLPENYRLPILLCDLEGRTIKEATRQLGWPQGTLAGRLARGRKLLAKRLASRGVVLSAGPLAAVISQNAASAGVPASLTSSTVKAAAMVAAGRATVAGVVPAKVAALTEGVLKTMLLNKLKGVSVVLVLAIVALATGSFIVTASKAEGPDDPEKPPASTTKADITTPLDVLDLFEIQNNDALGEEKFTGQRLRVTGTLVGVRRLKGSDHYSVLLYDGRSTSEADMWLVSPCFKFSLDARKELAKLEQCSILTIDGLYEGRTAEGRRQVITFADCKIVGVERPKGVGPAVAPSGSGGTLTEPPPPKATGKAVPREPMPLPSDNPLAKEPPDRKKP